MKLRLNHDAVRIRVFQDDLDTFRMQGRVAATTHVGPSAAFTYALEVDPRAEHPCVTLQDDILTVRVPKGLAEQWITTEQVGFEAEQEAGDGRMLHLLVEKDTGCRHSGGSDKKAFRHLSDRA